MEKAVTQPWNQFNKCKQIEKQWYFTNYFFTNGNQKVHESFVTKKFPIIPLLYFDFGNRLYNWVLDVPNLLKLYII